MKPANGQLAGQFHWVNTAYLSVCNRRADKRYELTAFNQSQGQID